MQITGKRVLITGGSSGIGFALARGLLENGARIVISGRRTDALDQALDTLGKFGEIYGVAADVATEAGRKATLDGAVDKLGGLDMLVNNAGAVRAGRLEDISDDEIRAMIEVDLVAPVLLTRAAMPALRSSGAALIINISSSIALVGLPFYAVYAAVKAGLARFGESLRRELDGEGIGVLTVYPTATDTPMMATSRMSPPGGRETAADVAAEIVDAIRDDRIDVVRGSPDRIEMGRKNLIDPAAVDAALRPSKANLEAAVRDHAAL